MYDSEIPRAFEFHFWLLTLIQSFTWNMQLHYLISFIGSLARHFFFANVRVSIEISRYQFLRFLWVYRKNSYFCRKSSFAAKNCSVAGWHVSFPKAFPRAFLPKNPKTSRAFKEQVLDAGHDLPLPWHVCLERIQVLFYFFQDVFLRLTRNMNFLVHSNSKFRVFATEAFCSEKSTETTDNSTEVSGEINETFLSVSMSPKFCFWKYF
jgi:hypothetical protein